jgi:hypothetical protein
MIYSAHQQTEKEKSRKGRLDWITTLVNGGFCAEHSEGSKKFFPSMGTRGKLRLSAAVDPIPPSPRVANQREGGQFKHRRGFQDAARFRAQGLFPIFENTHFMRGVRL